MVKRYRIDPEILDRIVDKQIKFMKKEGFIPDRVIGVSLGGSIIGKIFASKLGCDFSIDYRRNRRRYGSRKVEIEAKDSKMLVVEDSIDSGQSILCSTRDILKDLYPMKEVEEIFYNWLHYEYASSKKEYKKMLEGNFPEYQFKWFSLIFEREKSSQLDPDYYEYDDDLDSISESWKINREETIEMYKKCDYPWSQEVLGLFESDLLKDEHSGLEEFHREFPLGNVSSWRKYKNEKPDRIIFKLDLLFEGKKINKRIFVENCKEVNFSNCYYDGKDEFWETLDGIYLPGKNARYHSFDAEIKGNKLYIKFKRDDIIDYRTFGDKPNLMCNKCEFKPKSDDKRLPICLTCNMYVRCMETLKEIIKHYKLLEVDCKIILENNKIVKVKQDKIEDGLVKLKEEVR